VAFDMLVSRDNASHLRYERHLGPDLPKLELDALGELDRLPLRQEQRVIFGAKLAAIQRDRSRPVDDAKRWTVAFDPDSFVLITDAKVVKAMGLVPDEETPAVLERQRGWLK